MNQNSPNKKHLITVLVEDYFHVGAFENLIQQRNWSNFEPRYEQNTRKALDLLDSFKTKATFFVLGWIAEQNPGLVREIVGRGHEVASRGFYHRSLKNLTDEEFREDVRKTNRVLEEASGQKVFGYRAAEKLSYENDAWILDILADEGLAYDASFLPLKKDERNKRFARPVNAGGKIIHEFPYSTRDFGFGLLPISGGNYFRQIPYTMMRHAVQDWHARQDAPFVLYFHVWELDPEQPRISAASSFNRVRHYRKLDKMEWVLKEYLRRYDFVGGAEYLGIEVQCPESKVQSRAAPENNGYELQSARSENLVRGVRNPVTVVIPCYNEEPSLPYLANTLRSVEENLSRNYEPEFLFVDDASKDGTLDRLNELFGAKENVTIVKHDKNKGVAAGIMTGIKNARTEIVCSMDCDCTYDPHEIARMLPLLTDGVDMVTASPYHEQGGVRNVPEWRLFLSKGASWLYRRTLKSKLSTYTSCFRVYRRSSVVDLDLRENGFLGVAEMLGQVDLRGGTIVEYPAVLEVRLFGFSKMKTARTIFGHLKLLSHLGRMRLFGKHAPIATSHKEENLEVISSERKLTADKRA
jgi:polysaccharide deacetylase family protein (PEP-CTERM system associated)